MKKWIRLFYESGVPLMGSFSIQRVNADIKLPATAIAYALNLVKMRMKSNAGRWDHDRKIYFKLIIGEGVDAIDRKESTMELIYQPQ